MKSYIEKCKKAKELQNEWVLKQGSQFFAENTIWTVGFATIKDFQPVASIQSHNRYGSYIEDPKIWLPTIEDLIELCRKFSDYSSDWRLHTKMRMSMQKDYCSCYTKNISIKEMWLLIYMKYGHGKKWVEARKEWM